MKTEPKEIPETWIFAKPMIRSEDGTTGYSYGHYTVVNGEIIADAAVWDWNVPNGTSPLTGGRIKALGRSRE